MKIILSGISGFSERWVKAVMDTPGISLVGVSNRTKEKFPAFCKAVGFSETKCFGSLKEALSKVECDAVVVTVPTPSHYGQVREALLAGKHVLVEKPLAATLKESRALAKLANARKRILGVVSQHRYAPYLQELKRYCAKGGPLGKPLSFYIRIHMNRPASYYEVEARRTGPGVLTAQGVHAIDWIHWLFGKAKSCSSAMGTLLHKTNNEDTAAALLTMENGMVGVLDINHINGGKDELLFKVYFAKGTLQYGPGWRLTEEVGAESREIEMAKINPQFDSLKEQLKNFAQAVEGKAELDITAQDGVNVMTVLHYLYKSQNKATQVKYS